MHYTNSMIKRNRFAHIIPELRINKNQKVHRKRSKIKIICQTKLCSEYILSRTLRMEFCTLPERIRFVWDFQNCFWNISSSNIKEVMNLLKNIKAWIWRREGEGGSKSVSQSVSEGKTGPSYRKTSVLKSISPNFEFRSPQLLVLHVRFIVKKTGVTF